MKNYDSPAVCVHGVLDGVLHRMVGIQCSNSYVMVKQFCFLCVREYKSSNVMYNLGVGHVFHDVFTS